jgi:hypothetical protein
MSGTYTTLFYDGRHLIVKATEGNEPFVVAETYLAAVAEIICELLTEHAQKHIAE